MEVGLCWILAVALSVAPLALSQNCDEFSRRPNDTVAAEGGMACLYCDYPTVEDIVWQRDSTSIEADGTMKDICDCVATPGRPISLCFPDVQRDNADRYTCRATLGFGDTRECSARLSLAGAPNITNKEPAGPDVEIRNTQTITVSYNPGNPTATVQWSKDGQLINGSSNPHVRVSAGPNSTILTLTNNDPSIRGRYLVNVSNIGGSDTFQYNVKAFFGPNVTLTSSSLDNNRVRLTCSAQGYPELDRVAWQTGDSNAVSGSEDEINSMESSTFDFSLTSTLDLERSRCDGIVYRCSVSSRSITRSTSITCRIETVPVPQNFEISVINTTAVRVNWTRNNTLSYIVEYQLDRTDIWFERPTPAPPLVITNLMEGSTYMFRARSVNSAGGESGYSQVKTATPCRAPSNEVTGVSAELDSVGRRRAIRVSWQRSQELEVTGYRLYVTSNVASSNVPSPINIEGQDNTSYTLVPSSCDQLMYTISVAAWNGCGIVGPRSASVRLTCILVNRIFIQNLIPNDTWITVFWESDRVDRLESVVIIVIEQDISSNNQPRIMTYDVSGLMATERCVGGLKPKTSYRVCVNASYSDIADMQQNCRVSVTRQQDEMNDGVQCSLPTTTTGPSQTVSVPDWVIAVIVVGVLMIIAALFCFIGLCFACRNNEEKRNDFDSDSSIHTSSIRDGPMREMSPSRSCLSYHVKGHSVNWNEHVDTLRQMDTGGTHV